MAYESLRWRDYPGAKGAMCNTCAHNNRDRTCKAFPNGIPKEILIKGEHNTPFPGDNGIRYEPKEK